MDIDKLISSETNEIEKTTLKRKRQKLRVR